MRIAILLLVVTGCGPGVDFAGTYRGELTASASCQGVTPAAATMLFQFVQRGSDLRIPAGSIPGCPELLLDVGGSTAALRSAACSGGGLAPTDVVGGSFTQEADGLAASIDLRFSLARGPCDFRYSGPMRKI